MLVRRIVSVVVQSQLFSPVLIVDCQCHDKSY
jgi:hypothetical protein